MIRLFEEEYFPSIFDNDMYQFTMGQLIQKKYKNIKVRYRLKLRGKKQLTKDDIDLKQLQFKLNNIQLHDEYDELDKLKSTGLFKKAYINSLKNIELPEVKCFFKNDILEIESEGYWRNAVYLETPIMTTLSEMYSYKEYNNRNKNSVLLSLVKNLDIVDKTLSKEKDLKIVEFGTRRRFSKIWHEYLLRQLYSNHPNIIIGTSNIELGAKLNIPIGGTMAHQLFMVLCAYAKVNNIDRWNMIREILKMWKAIYPYDLRIVLPDTYYSEPFIKNVFSQEEFTDWKGIRQDSGTPEDFVNTIKKYYDLKFMSNKEVFFSDGLSLNRIIQLNNRYKNHFYTKFGWGTGLTNNCNIPYLNMVFKPEVLIFDDKEYPICKLSDTPGKFSGSKEEADEYIEYFGR